MGKVDGLEYKLEASNCYYCRNSGHVHLYYAGALEAQSDKVVLTVPEGHRPKVNEQGFGCVLREDGNVPVNIIVKADGGIPQGTTGMAYSRIWVNVDYYI